jgi:triacylglycerol lipase
MNASLPLACALVFAVSLAVGCASEAGLGGPDEAAADASVALDVSADRALDRAEEVDDGPRADCVPFCRVPSEVCEGGRCVCAVGYHEDGAPDGPCVPLGTCATGYGIRPGDHACVPLELACPAEAECAVPLHWSAGVCAFGPAEDGVACEGAGEGGCGLGFECRRGVCETLTPPCTDRRPVILVHGINGSSENFAVMRERLRTDGWPDAHLFAFDAADASWGCNVDNAAALAELLERALAQTCQPRVDIVAHSMGTLSSRYLMKNLGGHERVNTYVTLGGMHHGLFTPCLAPELLGVCVWQELCETGSFIRQLNADPATPGDSYWVSIFSTADRTVPAQSSRLEGAENIEFTDVDHDGENGLLQRLDVYEEVRRVLRYPCW